MNKRIGILVTAALIVACNTAPKPKLAKKPPSGVAPERIVVERPTPPTELPPIHIGSPDPTPVGNVQRQPGELVKPKTLVVGEHKSPGVPKGDDLLPPLPKPSDRLKGTVDPLGKVDQKLPNLRIIRVKRGETPGLLASWSHVSVADLERWNKLKKRGHLRIGQELTLVFDEEQWAVFKQKRAEFHKSKEDRFFEEHKVDTLNVYTVKKGDSLSRIAYKYGKIPLWVIKKFNKDRDLKRLTIGQTIFVPQLVAVKTSDRLNRVRQENMPPQANYTGLFVRVKARESMDLYARWSGLAARTIWQINRLKKGTPLLTGQRLMLPLTDRGVNAFIARRMAFHQLRKDQLSRPKSLRLAQRYTRASRFFLDEEKRKQRREKEELKQRHKTRKLGKHKIDKRTVNREPLQQLVKRRHKRKSVTPLRRVRVSPKKKAPSKKGRTMLAKNNVRRVIKYKMNKGDSAWRLATKKYRIPLDLLKKYNRDKNLDRLREGEVINIPILAAR
ncbi:MAG: LysM peptidoglycan-binding domain-containing protein [Myxococcales bacterium]|nr:LysM peptidoglycan-binding domain-containing protein [Myxococcales bacterium]